MGEVLDKIAERFGSSSSLQKIKFGRGVVGKLAGTGIAAIVALVYMSSRLSQDRAFDDVLIVGGVRGHPIGRIRRLIMPRTGRQSAETVKAPGSIAQHQEAGASCPQLTTSEVTVGKHIIPTTTPTRVQHTRADLETAKAPGSKELPEGPSAVRPQPFGTRSTASEPTHPSTT